MGLEMEGWHTVFANDISPRKFQMYKGFFPDADSYYTVEDIFKLDSKLIPPANLATCSFPCIDLSLAGNMRGIRAGAHSSAFWGFVRVLKEQGRMAPPILLLENVNGWLYSNGGEDFRTTILTLNELGYACDAFTLDARHFVPQSRPRVFVVATRLDIPTKGVRAFWHRSSALLSTRLRKMLMANKDLRWFTLELPDPPPLMNKGLSEIVEQIPEDSPRWWSEAETQRHLEMMSPAHLQYVVELAQKHQFSYRTFYRRRRAEGQRAEVRRDEVAGCLRTAIGGSGRQFLIRAGFGSIRMRVMTPREYARLQGVPDHYPISAPENYALTAFGDAVCIPVIRWIAQHALAPFLTGKASRQMSLFDEDGGQSLP